MSGFEGQETEYCCVVQIGPEIATLELRRWHSTEEHLLDNHKDWSSDLGPMGSIQPQLSESGAEGRQGGPKELAGSKFRWRPCLKGVRGQSERAPKCLC